MSAQTARSIRQADGLDKPRALQRVLYRSAKQDPTRRFHALYGHVARSDILARAWDDVRANRGAPGVDGIAIADVEASGVDDFLQELAGALRERTYVWKMPYATCATCAHCTDHSHCVGF